MVKNSKIIVAVSGGPDSMALLDMLRLQNNELVVAHVNYQQRETAKRDEEIVQRYCIKYGIPFELKLFENEDYSNFQDAARVFRYNFFKELLVRYEAEFVATGHHFDDDLETYVFQRNRKMKSDDVGLAKNSIVKGVRISRPLLTYHKEELIQYCNDFNIEYGIDESNLELHYTRNKIRHEISHLDDNEYQKLIVEMQEKRNENQEFKMKMNERVNSWENALTIKEYATIDNGYRYIYLREWLKKHGIEVYTMSESYLLEIDRNIVNESANYEFNNLVLQSSYDTILLYKKESFSYKFNDVDEILKFESPYFSIEQEGKKIEGITLTSKDFPLTIRSGKLDDQIKMRFGHKKLRRFFIDEKIPHDKRQIWPVVVNAEKKVIFVAGIGCDVHHYSNNPSLFMIELKVS
ncbi:tRNA lysidine(34) synthetase TilS [Erysipelothrix urinaevulpis]|uniref:tRNA lysidine(34) synthetase TilS n=1 Tax=Erysipelothrix urinaevulpis TaxID=2683717 RepID=UPI001359049C|nr:tRNA lysidine(34) synthetase TilS [Erysipelothrix urinaevulpis]